MDDCFPDWLLRIQLFRERLSHKSVKMNATLSKLLWVTMVLQLIEAQVISALEKEAAQTSVFMPSLSF